MVDRESSGAIPVKSGVPQGTALGPLMFLVYINDINENVTSSVQLFADDCVVYNRSIAILQDAKQLQEDICYSYYHNHARVWYQCQGGGQAKIQTACEAP